MADVQKHPERLKAAGVATTGLSKEQIEIIGSGLSDKELKELGAIQKKLNTEKFRKAGGNVSGGIFF